MPLAALVELLIPHVLSFVMSEIKRRRDAGEAPPTEEELRSKLLAKKEQLVAQADDFLRSKGVDPTM